MASVRGIRTPLFFLRARQTQNNTIFTSFTRFYSSAYSRDKIHINVGTIGHVDHGKTSLTSAITKVLADKGMKNTTYRAYGEIDNAPEERKRGITIAASHVEYESEKKHYSHVDCPGHQEFIKNMISGAASLDAAILVVDGVAGVMPQTKEHILLAKQVGVPQIIVWVNKCDLIEETELIEIVEMDIKDELSLHKFDADKIRFIRGSALATLNGDNTSPYGVAAVEQLIDALDNELEPPKRELDKPFLLSIKGVYSVGGRGTVATGAVEQGTVKIGDNLELIGMRKDGKVTKTACTGLEMFNKKLEVGQAGDDLGILLRGLKREEVRRGQVLCKPGSLKVYSQFKGSVYLLTAEEGGRTNGFKSGFRPQFYIRTADITGDITLPDNVEIAVPGDHIEITVNLGLQVPLEKGTQFSIREGGKTVGHGIVSEVF